MKRLNHYQKDILFLVIIILLQVIFSLIYPFQNPEATSRVAVSTRLIFLEFSFIDINESTMYIPILATIYALSLIFLLLQKNRRFALIYGFAIALVAKAYYLTELYSLSNNTYTNMRVNGFLSQKVLDGDTLLAQDVSLYVLGILFIIKVGIYLHDSYMKHKLKKTDAN
ncbi:MAG: hypothetical protein ACOCU1_02910 [Bacillota bacterium]